MNTSMIKHFLALVAYISSSVLIYSVVLENINWIDNKPFSYESLIELGNDTLSWGTHNLIFLITSIFASFISALISGALIKQKNTILFLVCQTLVLILFLFSWKDFLLSNIFTSIIAVIASMFSSVIGSKIGVDIDGAMQANKSKTTLGIHSTQWIWILLPITFSPMYLWGVCFVHAILRFFSLWWTSEEVLIRIASIICIIPIVAWILIPVYIYKILAGNIFEDKTKFMKSIISISIFIFGSAIAFSIQLISYFVIEKFLL